MLDKNFYSRLKNFFKSQGITQQEIGNALGTTQAYVNLMLNGRCSLGRATAQKLSDAYGLSMAWLLTGEGPMMAADVSATAGNNGVAVNGSNNTTNCTPATDLIASLVEANRQLTEQNAKLIDIVADQQKQITQLLNILSTKL